MKIAVLGGGFNPPHVGHFLVCEQVLTFTDNQEIWLMPYFLHPWEKSSLELQHRAAMAELMANNNIKVSDLEINLKRKNYTYETIDLLVKKYPQHDFSWVIGSDLLREFFSWEHAQEMSKKVKILVFPRAGWPISDLPENFYTIKNKLLSTSDISSEKIREMVKKGQSIKGLVLPKVEEYIYEHGLYQ